MTKAEAAALDYARTHMQAVRIVWVDREPESYLLRTRLYCVLTISRLAGSLPPSPRANRWRLC